MTEPSEREPATSSPFLLNWQQKTSDLVGLQGREGGREGGEGREGGRKGGKEGRGEGGRKISAGKRDE